MKNKNLNWIFVLIFIAIGFIFYSCNKDDNPIKPNPPSELIVDSNFFDWKIDTIGGTIGGLDLYIADTNKIFTIGYAFGSYLNNGKITRINYLNNDQYFQANCVNGTSDNNVFFGGCIAKPNDKIYSRLKKWDGNNIINIPMPADTCAILKIVVNSENDLWMATSSNIIYHYINSQTVSYRVDSTLNGGYMCKDDLGNLYTTFSRRISENNFIFYVYKYQNDNWNAVYRDSVYFQSELRDYCRSAANKLVRIGLTGYYYFTGSNWVKFLNTGNMVYVYECGGGSFENILFQGEEYGLGLGYFLHFYNGKQIYRQRNYHFTGELINKIQFKFGRFYFITYDYDNWEIYVGTGTLKKTNLKSLNPKKNEENKFINSNNNINN